MMIAGLSSSPLDGLLGNQGPRSCAAFCCNFGPIRVHQELLSPSHPQILIDADKFKSWLQKKEAPPKRMSNKDKAVNTPVCFFISLAVHCSLFLPHCLHANLHGAITSTLREQRLKIETRERDALNVTSVGQERNQLADLYLKSREHLASSASPLDLRLSALRSTSASPPDLRKFNKFISIINGQGILSLSVDGDNMMVVGDGIDAVKLTMLLRKNLAKLQEFLRRKEMDKHLDADEEIALGSSQLAANLSDGIKLNRELGMIDGSSYGFMVELIGSDLVKDETTKFLLVPRMKKMPIKARLLSLVHSYICWMQNNITPSWTS
ncbi:hypothetical protein M5K25_026608 [Dendrobium thyrsiflorum]|uniref:Uncharacterized protein n=1 Tax=Dendrobium thyrsiflorum TaxID=117978 RepID=A0ABD0TXR9_DENTH